MKLLAWIAYAVALLSIIVSGVIYLTPIIYNTYGDIAYCISGCIAVVAVTTSLLAVYRFKRNVENNNKNERKEDEND